MPRFGQPGAPPRGPGGRRKIVRAVEAEAREYGRLAIETLASICEDRRQSGAARVAAANALLDRAWGKARQDVTIEADIDVRRLTDDELDRALRDEFAEFISG